MRVLIISSGLKPEHFGGLPSHVEDLLNALCKRSVNVSYLSVGARSKLPISRVWRRKGSRWKHWNLSSSLAFVRYWDGTAEPMAQVEADPSYSKAFMKVIRKVGPDVVHFHELTSFPIELFDALRKRSIKTVFSTADFYALCPTVKLHRPDGTFCDRRTEDLDCEKCSLNASLNRMSQWMYVNDCWLGKIQKVRNLGRRLVRSWASRTSRETSPCDYIERRRRFDEILGRVNVILNTSKAQKEIFERNTNGWNIKLLQRSRETILRERPEPRSNERMTGKLVFLALNIVNPAKGLSLLEDAFAKIHAEFPWVELHLYGLSEGTSPGITYFGSYDDSQLDDIIGSADFGLLPSVWPEAFGYVGPEMLSRGLPVIASNRGAMPDYVIDYENGLLFDPSDSENLVKCVRELICTESLRRQLWHGAARGKRRYLTMDEHVDRLVEIYRGLTE